MKYFITSTGKSIYRYVIYLIICNVSNKCTIILGCKKIIPEENPATAVDTDDITTYYFNIYSLIVELSGTHKLSFSI